MMKWRVALILCSVIVLSGCQYFKSKTNRDNIAPPAELVDFSPSVKVSKAWGASFGRGERKLGLRQAPAAMDGRVFAASPDGELSAFDAASGKPLWQVDSELRWSGGPGVGEGTLVVGALNGQVVAFNPDTGSERWRSRVSSEVISEPAIGRGLAVVRSNDGRVFAFSSTTGERRWVYDRSIPALTVRGNARPIIEGSTVYLGYDSGTVVALDLNEGRVLWEQVISEGEGKTELERMVDIDGDMAATASELYVASYRGNIVALDAGSGRPLWTRDMSVYAGVTLAGDRLLVSDEDGTVWSLDRRSGASQWRQDGLAHRWLTTPAVVGNYAVVGDLKGYLHWLDLSTGEFAARNRLDRDPIRAPLRVLDGVVYSASIDGKLAAYRPAP
jgi:outer membrane protein assembly factor BamB